MKRTAWVVAPATVRHAISKGLPVDYTALMAWWLEDCPMRLKGLSPDTAALMSSVTQLADPTKQPHISIVYRED